MEKKFFETFPGLIFDEKLQELLNLVTVTQINYTRDRKAIRVYIQSPRLIQKETIYRIEKQMQKQLFGSDELKVILMERFHLSSQYTPENLFQRYQDSILLEMRNASEVAYSLLHHAKWQFEEGKVRVEVENTLWGRRLAPSIGQHLEKIFCERCGFHLIVEMAYYKKDNKKQEEERKKREIEIVRQRQIERVSQETAATKETTELPPWETAPSQTPQPIPAAAKEPVGKAAPQPREKTAAAVKVQSAKPQSGRHEWKKEGQGRQGKGSFRGYKRSENPDVIYGRDFEGEVTSICDLEEGFGEVIVKGKLLSLEKRELRGGLKFILIFTITDYTDTIVGKIFIESEFVDELCANLKEGEYYTVKGVCQQDKFDRELGLTSIAGVKKSASIEKKRIDNAPKKRVELHCHTKASEMDGVSDAKVLVKQAKAWGHPALAITDHGCAYAFPEAFHAVDRKDTSFKIIYGVEGYLVDDTKEIVANEQGQTLSDTFVVFDIETTGFSPIYNHIIEIGAVKISEGKIVDRYSTFVNPKEPIPFRIEQLTGINDDMVINSPQIDTILPEFLAFCQDAVLVAHNASFDVSFICQNAANLGIAYHPTYIDTVAMARVLLPKLNKYKLDIVAKALDITLKNHHRAVDDAECCGEIFLKLVHMFQEKGVETLADIDAMSKLDVEAIRKMPYYHIILLAKNETGRINLYRLISQSHVTYFHRQPRIPRSLLNQYREGLIIGSACEAGELYQALLRGEPDAEIARIVEFYDYLEIQPTGNNKFMILKEDIPAIQSEKDIEDMNRRICDLGDQFHKPVCATCDVHFMNPEDEVYRRIIMAGKGFSDADNQAPLYFRTTEEMLEEFQYLGSEKAEEVVITNTNLIADSIDRIEPVRPDKCPPVIPNADVDLREMCYHKARSIYGASLPPIVEERLERELNSIISNGFAVMYIIAQKLVNKSNEDGYMVGSRGSVGSSFVATMSGITEVNPLSPHYICSNCHYSDFESDEVRAFAGGAGCDMPDKNCPVCGQPLQKEGFDIPFETFLGFKGNKEPDIDLNFSGEYQSKAHAYTEVIFGAGQTFRAGTVGTVADKTAFGYVKNYFEERDIHKRNAEVVRLAAGCAGVRRSSGQHPGGIIVLPLGEEINSFTPVQHPANDMTTNIITTHFDYHSIDHNLLKLDILGHDDPTMIRMLEDLTGLDARKIPLDDQKVMSLFQNTSALGITPDDIMGCKLGALGIPEFGTDFAMGMLMDTKPQHFSDLVRIAGLSHGTDVWLGNAQTLLQEGKATISTCICTRDDIMTYLINKGMDKEESFTIMESVRKGKGLKPEWEEHMIAHDVPDWYIWSCKKIKYMFPKAHAAAYVMMAWRIAYCKVYHPLAYYAAYFSIRATGFTYELMCLGKAKLEAHMRDFQQRKDSLSPKEEVTYKDMRVVQEMYARGYDFVPIDIYKAKAQRFQIVDGKLMPSFAAIDGLGEKAAQGIEEAASFGEFLSLDDFRERSKVSKTMIDKMVELGILKGLPQSNQLSLFDI